MQNVVVVREAFIKNIQLGPMGVLAPVSAHAGPSIGTSGNFRANFTKFPHFPIKIGLIGGVGGIPQISFSLDS